jgi:hypothetical protein
MWFFKIVMELVPFGHSSVFPVSALEIKISTPLTRDNSTHHIPSHMPAVNDWINSVRQWIQKTIFVDLYLHSRDAGSWTSDGC